MLKRIFTPFCIVIDSREKAPFLFENIKMPSGKILQAEIKFAALPVGDYSIAGCETEVAIERKSTEDLFGSIGSQRKRFERECAKLANYKFAAVVVESTKETIEQRPPPYTIIKPHVAFQTAFSWTVKYRIPWLFENGRQQAEFATFQLLRFYWTHFVIKSKREARKLLKA